MEEASLLEARLDYIPSELVSGQDVIIVTIQYRLGVLGFLSSGDDVISGNYGLWDQTLAINWVKDNIQAFGGDPNSMTLFGESAGAGSVGYQMLTPAMKGINFRAILQSGTPLSPWALNQKPQQALYALANATGCLQARGWLEDVYSYLSAEWVKYQHQQVLTCLRGKDAETLIKAFIFLPDESGLKNFLMWVPTVDGDFIPRAPAELLRDVTYLNDVGALSRDVMLGLNNNEGAYITLQAEFFRQMNPGDDERTRALLEAFAVNEKMVTSTLTDGLMYDYGKDLGVCAVVFSSEREKDSRSLETIINVLDFFYTKPLKGEKVEVQDIADVVTDAYYTVPTVRFVRALAQASDRLRALSRTSGTGGRRYLYLFNHYPSIKTDPEDLKGMYHGEDLAYEFDGNPYYGPANFNSDDIVVARTFKSMLANFAKNGEPQLVLQSENGGSWPEFSTEEQQYLSLAPTPRVQQRLYNQRVALWLDLVPSLVNSTRSITSTSWQMPWNWQSQNSCQNGYGYYSNCMSSAPMYFHFKGRVRFFPLH